MPTVVGVFRYSGDAHLAADHLLTEYGLTEGEVEVLGPGDEARLRRPGPGNGGLDLEAYMAFGPGGAVGEDPVAARWGAEVWLRERTLVVARIPDEDEAAAVARDLRRAGAAVVDLIPT